MWINLLLISMLVVCVVTDLKERKIYNKVLLPVLMMAWLVHLLADGITGMKFSLIGTSVGLAILFIPFLLGGMGAGDVKLLAVVGALKGTSFVLYSALYMAIVGGVMALLILLFHKGVKQRFYGIAHVLNGFRAGVVIPVMVDRSPQATTYPYGVAIAAGALLQLVLPYGGLLS